MSQAPGGYIASDTNSTVVPQPMTSVAPLRSFSWSFTPCRTSASVCVERACPNASHMADVRAGAACSQHGGDPECG